VATLSIGHWQSNCPVYSNNLMCGFQLHRVRKNGPAKENAVKCTVYNTIQWHLHSII